MPHLYRSMLFVSGERPERFAKARAAGADLVCIDLEDAVAPQCKVQAREDALAFVRAQGGGGMAVRFNGLRTREGLADVAAWVQAGVRVDVVILPKVESAQELALFHAWASACAGMVVALIESAEGIEQVAGIAAAAHRQAPSLGALMLGGADLSAELQAAFDWDGLLHARGRLVNAARSAGLQAWDVPHIDVRDLDGLASETRRVAALGFDCKTAIHPGQIPVIHDALAPDPAQAEWARALLSAFEAGGANKGAFLFGGRMVDAPVLARARQIVRRAAINPAFSME